MRSFITATSITKRLCSPSRDGQDLLPQLVANLIKNSVSKEVIKDFRFPHTDQVYMHGEDGILVIDDEIQHLYVPNGISVWEMGTETPPRSKANKDFPRAEAKLANAFPNVEPSISPEMATVVFVSSASFQDHEKWIKEKRQVSKWKSINVIDAVALADWLEQCPSVMLWFADVCGLPAEGLYDAKQYLRKLGIDFGVSDISQELIIAGRIEINQQLHELILNSNLEVYILGESVEEAAAFLAASALKDSDTYGKKSPLVFADSQANLNLLATTGADATLVPVDSNALKRVKMIEGHRWRLVIPEVESVALSNLGGKSLKLGQCKRVAIEQYLIEKLKLPEHKVRQIVRDSKGSLNALLWLIGSGPIGMPRWASRKDATTHASLILAGSWIGSNINDTNVIERLSRQAYRNIETLLQSAQIPEGPWIHRGAQWLCASKDFVWSQLIGKVTETMLDDFHGIARDVVGEKDPSLELSPSKRYMASILGKTRKYSSSLRRGLVDSVARLSIFKPEGQAWSNRIVRELLDPEAPDAIDQWLSLTDVYSEIAEAAPTVFLECLDQMVKSDDGKRFFQDAENDNFLFGPSSAHVYLLWALERLAWQKEYFPRVLSILAKLAEIDPVNRRGNSPKNSLITILLPWSPQHSETMQSAIQVIRMLYSNSPEVTWDVCIELLPTSHGVTSPTPTPTYREHSGDRKVTVKEYRDFISMLVVMMIEWAEKYASRWASLVKAYPEVRSESPENGQLITDALTHLNIDTMSDADKSIIHDALREQISHHCQFPEAKWSLPDFDLEILKSVQDRFKPEDTVLQHSYLFFSCDPHVYDAPMKPYEDGWDNWITEKREKAVKAIYKQSGLEGIIRLSQNAILPDYIGYAIAELKLTEDEEVELLQKGTSTEPIYYSNNPMALIARAYVFSKYRKEGEKWLEHLLASPKIIWTPESYANLALGLPPSPTLWDQLEKWGQKADMLYWQNVEIRGNVLEHWPRVIEKWKKAIRPWSSLKLLARLVNERNADTITKKPSADQVMDILDQALNSDESVEPLRRKGQMLAHYAEQLFIFLDSQSVDPERMAQLEWSWLRVIEHTKRGAKVLPKQVTSSPKIFVELLKVVYRAEGEPKKETISEDEKKIGRQASHLLEGIHTIPGLKSIGDDKIIDPSVLQNWVNGARKLAQDIGRLKVCDTQIGHILSYAPQSPDGSWPCVEVRDLIEEIQSSNLDNGFRTGKYNQRGVVFRGPGGKQEWDLVKHYQELAERVRIGWPRTAAILDNLAKDYEYEAKHWDEEAKRDEYE